MTIISQQVDRQLAAAEFGRHELPPPLLLQPSAELATMICHLVGEGAEPGIIVRIISNEGTHVFVEQLVVLLHRA